MATLLTCSSLQAQPLSTEIKGLRVGMAFHEVADLFPDVKREGDLATLHMSIAGIGERLTVLTFMDSTVQLIQIAFEPSSYRQVEEAVQHKYPGLNCLQSGTSRMCSYRDLTIINGSPLSFLVVEGPQWKEQERKKKQAGRGDL